MTLFDPEEGAAAPAPGVEAAPRPPVPGGVRIRMGLAYDGAGFHGFAAQPGVVTVAGALAQALNSAIGHPVQITCAGRTDSGVHARGQVVHFDVWPDQVRSSFAGVLEAARRDPGPGALDPLRRACNRMLSPRIVVGTAELAPPGFDARRSARWRRYRYTVLNREDPDPFLARTAWHVDDALDLRAMQLACDPLYGEHDFAAFCRQRPDGTASTTRRVMDAMWSEAPAGPDCDPGGPGERRPSGRGAQRPRSELLVFDIRASAFCHQMVRSLVGTMVDVGRGRLRAGDVTGILASRSRSAAGVLAPPHGLCLEEVGYDT